MRDISSIADRVSQPITEPVWLAHLSFSTPQYLSSGPELDYAGMTFRRSGLRVENVFSKPILTIGQRSGEFTAFVLQDKLIGRSARIWVAFSDGSILSRYTSTSGPRIVSGGGRRIMTFAGRGSIYAGELLFDGEMSHATDIDPHRVVIVCKRTFDRRDYAPRVINGPPLFNHLTPAGTEIGGVTFQSRRG